MTYVMSDLHGMYDKYLAMLDKIGFSDEDELYILGDILDRGPQPVDILMDMSLRANVYPLLGNHEMMALMLLRRLCVEITDENYATQIDGETIKAMAMWQFDGGQTTLDGFKALPKEERLALLDYLEEFSPWEELWVNGRRFVLVHGGIPYEKRNLPLEEHDIRELVTARPDYAKRYYDDAFLVTGHTPTFTIAPGCKGRIYSGHGHLAIDCGACFDHPLACIRLEDLQEFYE